MSTKKNVFSVQNLTRIGLMSALVFVMSYISIPLAGTARIHMGNIMCLLSGILFGPFIGGISSGLGSMIFDLTNPIYAPEFWITFITKFAMGFVAGILYKKAFKNLANGLRLTISSLVGSLTYIVLYLSKTLIVGRYVTGLMGDALWTQFTLKATTSLINGAIAVVGCVVLANILQPALAKAGVLPPPVKLHK